MSGSNKRDTLDAVFTLASVWLALRGESAEAIGARAHAAARAAETTRNRLEAFVMGSVRQHVGCNQPAPCKCLVCSAYEAERAERKRERAS
jgi:hypothetical protein